MAATIKLFIVDDHHMVIEGIYSLLQQETQLEWMGHATNADSCLAFLRGRQPDVLFMDISLGDTSGIDLCKTVKELYPSIFIIGLSTFNQQSFIKKMMEHGASGYVLKNATRQELLQAIETVRLGQTYLSQEAAQTVSNEQVDGVPILTRREKEVLEWIAEGLTNQEIADKLFISSTTVDTHRKNLLAKFNARNVAAMIKMAARMQVI
jgi:DNA-binding NarL/FixJ family response regulator